jgi:D-3-phosphoglycerate dehydrogenase
MKSIFIDCNEQLAPIWARVVRPDDPPITVNLTPRVGDELPRVIGDHEIALDDHSYMPTELVAQCPRLKHIVFLGTGARSYMNPEELAELGISVHLIKGYGDTAVAESAIALMWASARVIAVMDELLDTVVNGLLR